MRSRLTRALVATMSLALVGLSAAVLTPQVAQGAHSQRHVPGGSAPRPIVTGWMPYWMPSTATSSVTSHAALFDEASPFLLQTTSTTGVDYQGSATTMTSMVQSLHAVGVKVVPTLTTSMNADQFAALLSSRRYRAHHVRTIVALAQQFGVDGIDLDYENINFGSGAAKDVVRAKYPVLLAELDASLEANGMVSSVTVPSRRSDDDSNWWVYDYRALGAAVDRFRIMTYDYSWSGGAPGPMAPRQWVDQVVAYATSRVTASKISFGLPAYGRDWFVGKVSGRCPASARASMSRTTQGMQDFAGALGVSPSWQADQTSRRFTYRKRYSSHGKTCTVKREAWFDDARSVSAKLPLVEKYGLRGVAIWALGNETTGMWNRLRSYAVDHPVLPATVSVSARHTVTFGRSSSVTGVVRVAGRRASGAKVSLWRRPVGGRWSQVSSAKSGSAGAASFAVAPRRHTSYQLRTPTTWGHKADRSSVATTRVAYAVYVTPTSARVSVDSRRFLLNGVVAPGLSGTKVQWQRLVRGHWHTRGTETVGADGRFAFSVLTRRPGVRTLRVVALPGVLDVGRSSRVTLRVH